MKPEKVFTICKVVGFSLIFALWLFDGQLSGFFLIVMLVMMSVIRNRLPSLKYTVLIDVILCLCFVFLVEVGRWDYAGYALALSLFSAMYLGVYFSLIISGVYLLFEISPLPLTILTFSALCGLFLRFWALEYKKRLRFRDKITGEYYEMENFQYELSMALMEVERTASISERTKIARDIHDNAGHEIVAAYISFQAIRKLLDSEKTKKATMSLSEGSVAGVSPAEQQGLGQSPNILKMYDNALKRLNNGTRKIRETAHNLQSATVIGVESLSEACRRFPMCSVDFHTYGDTMRVPMYVWNVLNSCLNECLTNIIRHSHAKKVVVTLDAAKYIVRLCVENDGVPKLQSYVKDIHRANAHPVIVGMGLRNIRQRTIAVGGSLSVDACDMFRVICVVPIKETAEIQEGI